MFLHKPNIEVQKKKKKKKKIIQMPRPQTTTGRSWDGGKVEAEVRTNTGKGIREQWLLGYDLLHVHFR